MILEPPKIKSVTVSIVPPSILYEFTPSHTNYTFCLEDMWFWQWGWDVDEHVMVRILFLHWRLLPDSREQGKSSLCSRQRWLAGTIPQQKHPLRLRQPLPSEQRGTVSADISCITFPFWELMAMVFSKGAFWKLSFCMLNAVWYFPKRMHSPFLTIFVCFLIICLIHFIATLVDLPFCYSR